MMVDGFTASEKGFVPVGKVVVVLLAPSIAVTLALPKLAT
jgi:hypothetical protein